MPRFAHTLSVSAPPATVFGILDDFTQTPLWLSRCTGLDKADGVGTTLTHTIDIGTVGVGKLFTPMIRRSLPKQTIDAMAKLKAMAEERSS